jgi:Alanine-zipper, major outer membrane lipoprotein
LLGVCVTPPPPLPLCGACAAAQHAEATANQALSTAQQALAAANEARATASRMYQRGLRK